MDRPKIILRPWEYEWASHVGARRYIENWKKQNAPYYHPSRMEDDRTAQVAACVAELAVARFVNQFWSGHAWHLSEHSQYKTLADVGENIEVRRLRTKESAAVRRHQLGKKLILFVAKPILPELREVIIYGCRDYDEAWELGTPSDYDPNNTREVGPEHLIL
ncbi:hypothetical protein EBZ39_06175 [bacterium]|nr:hypothetical protein [bacterium]